MDPVSQGVVGAVVAGAFSKKDGHNLRRSLVIGALSAMSADLDVLIHSENDPLLSLMFHRHFTHSLIFIPLGALICSWILSFFFRMTWRDLYRPAFLGYMTAAPLDALTSYGTHLLWPFADARTAFNCISIVDPIYTVTLIALAVFSFVKINRRALSFGILFMFFWHGLGFIQRERAENVVLAYANENNVQIKRIWVQPSIFNLVVWRALIETDKKIHVLCVRVGANRSLYKSGAYDRYDPDSDNEIRDESTLKKDIIRFTKFSSGFVAKIKIEEEFFLTDARYSPLPWSLNPLWALNLEYNNQNRHAQMKYFRDTKSLKFQEYWETIKGQGIFRDSLQPLDAL